MRFPHHLALIFGALLAPPALAETPDWAALMAEAAWDWHPGDLIFRNGLDPNDERLRAAMGGDWASVGILRSSSGGPRVVYADRNFGVTEVMLDEFVAGLVAADYAVYRVEAVDPNGPGRQMVQGPVANFALRVAYGAGYDGFRNLANDTYSTAELAYLAVLSAGVALGAPATAEALATGRGAVREALLADWQAHPGCVGVTTSAACWERIRGQQVVTPGQLIASGAMTRVFPK